MNDETLEDENVRLRALLTSAGIDPAAPPEKSGTVAPGAQVGGDCARRQAIIESAIDFAMVVTNPDGIVTDWNPGAEHIMGWTAAEMRGQNAERFFTPEDQANGRIETEMRRSLEDGGDRRGGRARRCLRASIPRPSDGRTLLLDRGERPG